MERSFSIYLDLVRFSAACLVYLYHSNQRWLIQAVLPASNYGHASVIVFFVLSGFVISHVASSKERTWPNYAASRLARVFSVVVPALVLCLVLDAVGRQLSSAYTGYPFDHFGLRLLGSLLMLNEIWLVSITSFSNVPFWSISFEFWYYVLFGMVMFLPRRTGLLAAALLLLVLGPKIALLAPLWVIGVLLHRWAWLSRISLAAGWAFAVGASAIIVMLFASGVFDWLHEMTKVLIGAVLYEQLTFAKFFAGDYLLGLLVMLQFAGMRRIAPALGGLILPLEQPVRWLAKYTFTLYLTHQPLFLFWGSVIRGNPATLVPWLLTTALVAISVLLVGHFTENQRGPLKTWIQLALERIERRRTRVAT